MDEFTARLEIIVKYGPVYSPLSNRIKKPCMLWYYYQEFDGWKKVMWNDFLLQAAS